MTLIQQKFLFEISRPKVNNEKEDRNIKRGTLSQAQARKYYRQVIALVNQKRALDKRGDKLRKEADKIHNILAR